MNFHREENSNLINKSANQQRRSKKYLPLILRKIKSMEFLDIFNVIMFVVKN